MNIALIAHETKKDLLTQFCTAYAGILGKHTLCAPSNIARLLQQSARFEVDGFLSETTGGADQLLARVSYNEIDLVINFRDALCKHELLRDEIELMRLCDAHNVPFATNVASAEMLIHGLERGDLDWREIIKR